jgi:hypothetical protein
MVKKKPAMTALLKIKKLVDGVLSSLEAKVLKKKKKGKMKKK